MVLSVVDVEIVISTSLVIVRVTESPVSIEDEKSAELLVTEIKLHMKTVENTKHVLHTV